MLTKSKNHAPIDIPEFAPFQQLDAGAITMDEAATIRSEARLEQIFANAPNPHPAKSVPVRRTRAKVQALRWAAIPVLAVSIIAGTVALTHRAAVVPPAFANWTPVPTSMVDMPNSNLNSYNAACQDFINNQLDAFAPWVGAVPVPRDVLQTLDGEPLGELPPLPTQAETRGDLTWLVYRLNPDQAFYCVIETSPIPATVEQIVTISLTNPSFGFDHGNDFMMGVFSVAGPGYQHGGGGGSLGFGQVSLLAPLAPNQEMITNIAETQVLPLGIDGREGDIWWRDWEHPENIRIRMFDGLVGSDVVGVELHTRGGESFSATVSDGRLIAWFPHPATLATERLLDHITVTLSDGSILTQTPLAGQ